MPRYLFGRFSLDERAGELRSGGEIILLQPKAYELLLLLLREPGALITREQIERELWPGVHVTDASLFQAIRRLRLAIGNDAIANLPKRGYRLDLAVERQPDSPSPQGAPPDPSFVGREDLIARAGAALCEQTCRLTLHGPGGIGKTRLARQILRTFAPSARYIDLGAVQSREGFVRAVALGAGVRIEDGEEPICVLARCLSGVTVAFDGAEHARAHLAELVSAMDAPKVLVASRWTLGYLGEQVIEVPPLSADEARALWRLFAPQAEEGSETLDPLLARLDYHPLSIELTAARAATLGTGALLRRIDARGIASLAPPQSPISRIAESSWQSISADARRALSLLAALPSPLSVEDLECAYPETDWLDAADELRKAAWLRPERAGFVIPGPLREYVQSISPAEDPAIERVIARLIALVRAGDPPPIAQLLWALDRTTDPARYLPLAARALAELSVSLGASRLQQDIVERAAEALAAIAIPDPIDASRLELELAARASQRSQFGEAISIVERALARRPPPSIRAALEYRRIFALGASGRADEACGASLALLSWADDLGDLEAIFYGLSAAIGARRTMMEECEDLIEQGLDVARRLGSVRYQIAMLLERAESRRRQGHLEEARTGLQSIIEISKREALPHLQIDATHRLGLVLMRLKRYDDAVVHFEEVIAQAERSGAWHTALKARGNLSTVLLERKDPRAEAALLQTLADAERSGVPKSRDVSLSNLGKLYAERGELDRAERCLLPLLGSDLPQLRNEALGDLADIAILRKAPAQAREWIDKIDPNARSEGGEIVREAAERRLSEAFPDLRRSLRVFVRED